MFEDDLFLRPREPFPTSRSIFQKDLDNFISARGHPEGLRDNNDFDDAYKLDTLIGQHIVTRSLKRRFDAAGIDLTPQPGFNAYENADFEHYPMHIFLGTRSPGEVLFQKRLYDGNSLRRERLDQSVSGLGRIFANLADPINIIPVPFAKAASIGKGIKSAGTAGFATFAPFEIARANIDPTSTPEESLFAIGGATILTGLLGGGISALAARNLNKISHSYFAGHAVVDAVNELNNIHPNSVEAILPRKPGDSLETWVVRRAEESPDDYQVRLLEIESDPTTMRRYQAISDSYNPGSELIETGIGLEKVRSKQHPWLFIKNTKFYGILGNRLRRLVDEISGSPGMYEKGNENFQASAQSAHIRALQHNVALVNFHTSITEGFIKSEGSDPTGWNRSEIGSALGSMGRSLPGVKAGSRQKDFDADVSSYYMNPKQDNSTILHIEGKHENYVQSVKEAAEGLKTYMEYMGREAQAVGIFGMRAARARLDTLNKRLAKLEKEDSTGFTQEDFDADVSSALGKINRRLNRIDKIKKEIEEVENKIRRLASSKEKGEIPKVRNDPSLGHWPVIWKTREVQSRRLELVKILDNEYVDAASKGARIDETIGRILGQGEFARLTPALKTLMKEAGLSDSSVKAWIKEFEDIINDAKVRAPAKADLQVAVMHEVRPFLKKFLIETRAYRVKNSSNKVSQDLSNSIPPIIADILDDIEDMAASGTSGNFGTSVNALARKINIPPHLVKDFIETDPSKVVRLYHRRMAVSIEMGRRFDGDPSMTTEISNISRMMDDQIKLAKGKDRAILEQEKIDTIEAIEDLRDKVLGVYRIPRDPTALSYRATQFTKNWMALSLMGQPIIASLADLGKIQMALGWKQMFGAAFSRATSGKRAFRLAGDEAKKAGIGSDIATRMRFEMLMDFDSFYTPLNKFEEFTSRNVDRLFFVNMLTPYTDWLKVFTGSIMQSNIIELSQKVVNGETITRTEKLWVTRSGLDAEDLKSINSQWKSSGAQKDDILYLANTDDWTDKTLANKFRTALATEVENAVITPGPNTRLNFMSTNIGSLMTQFKNFSFAATHQILMAGLQQRDAYALQALSSMIGIGALIDLWKSPDYDNRSILSVDRLVQAVDYSGVTGILFDINNMMEVVTGHGAGIRPLLGVDPIWKNPTVAQRGGQVFGPIGSLGGDFVWSMTSPDAEGSDVARSIRRLLPYNNLIWWDSVVDQAQREIGKALEN